MKFLRFRGWQDQTVWLDPTQIDSVSEAEAADGQSGTIVYTRNSYQIALRENAADVVQEIELALGGAH